MGLRVSIKFLRDRLLCFSQFLLICVVAVVPIFASRSANADVKFGETWCYDNPLSSFVRLTTMFESTDMKFLLSTYLNNIDETKKPNLKLTPAGQMKINERFSKNPIDQNSAKQRAEQAMILVSEDSELKKLFLEAGEWDGVSIYSKVSKCLVWVHISGKITKADFQKTKKYLAKFKRKPYVRVTLDSNGGEVGAAIALGRLFRDHLGIVDMQGSCLSACVLVYASGIGKLMQAHMVLLPDQRSKIGVHHHFLLPQTLMSLSLEDSLILLDKTEREILNYLEEMGASKDLMKLAKSTLPEDIYFLSGEELRILLPHVLSNYLMVIESKTQTSNFFFEKKLMELYLDAINITGDWRQQIQWLANQLDNIENFDEWRMGPMDELRMAKTLQFTYQ